MNTELSLAAHLPSTARSALVLTGGGARGAYQIGVLKAISEQFPDLHYPFPIICGTSAGALNAAGIAGGGEIFRHSIEHLERLWAELRTEQIFRSDYWGMARRMGNFLRSFMSGENGEAPASMLDNTPLRAFVSENINLEQMRHNITHRDLRALCVTACGYHSGQSVSFFEAEPGVAGWNLGQRAGVPAQLGIEHLMASSAIPTLFPAEPIGEEYYGDGVVRNMAPLSPAIHLGAERILIIGVSANRVCSTVRRAHGRFPKLPTIMEQMINGAFLDTVDNDIDRALMINDLLPLIEQEKLLHRRPDLRPLDLLVISPSVAIDDLASRHVNLLPKPIKQFLGLNKGPYGSISMASYLLFESAFTRELITLGYHDAQVHARQIETFLTQRSLD